MALVGKQQFSSNSFAGLGGRTGSSSGGRVSRFGGSMGIGSGGGLGFSSSAYGKGFGGGGGGGGASYSGVSTRTLGSGMSSAGAGRSRVGSAGDTAVWKAAGGAGFGSNLAGNGKIQMQSLNDRLAVFLEKVRVLEASNSELEEKLRTVSAKDVVAHDFTVFDAKINPLLEQLLSLMIQSRGIALQIDNARLTADDYKLKWEMEVSARQTVEGDVAGLRAVLREYNQASQAANQDLQALTDQLTTAKKDHELELEARRGTLSGNINVNVQAAKSIDLASVMTDIRAEYEGVMERNRQQAENWYTKQVEMKQDKTVQETETIVGETNEVKDLRKQTLILQTQLEALRKGNLNIETRMAELKGQFQVQLQRMSHQKDRLEADLSSVHHSVESQGQEYQNLLNIKSRLETEIRTYKQLLEGSDAPMSSPEARASVGVMVTKTSVMEVKTVKSGEGEPVATVSGGGGGGSVTMTTVNKSSRTSSSSSGGPAVMSSRNAVTSSREGSTAMETSRTVTIASTSTDATCRGRAAVAGSATTTTITTPAETVSGAAMTSSGGETAAAIIPPGGGVTSSVEKSTVINTNQTVTTSAGSGGNVAHTADEATVQKSVMSSGGDAVAPKLTAEGGAIQSVKEISTVIETPHTVIAAGHTEDASLHASVTQKSMVSPSSAADATATSSWGHIGVAMMPPGDASAAVQMMSSGNAAAVQMMSSVDANAVHTVSSGKAADVQMMSSGDPAAVHMMSSGNTAAVQMMSSGAPAAVHMMSPGDPAAVQIMSSGDPSAVHMMSLGDPAMISSKSSTSVTVISSGNTPVVVMQSSGVPTSVAVMPSKAATVATVMSFEDASRAASMSVMASATGSAVGEPGVIISSSNDPTGGSGLAGTAHVSREGAERVEAVSVGGAEGDSGAAVMTSGGMAMSTEGGVVEAVHTLQSAGLEMSSSGGTGMSSTGVTVDSGVVAKPVVEAVANGDPISTENPSMK